MFLGKTISETDLYGDLPRLSDKIRQRRMRLAWHYLRHPELSASELFYGNHLMEDGTLGEVTLHTSAPSKGTLILVMQLRCER